MTTDGINEGGGPPDAMAGEVLIPLNLVWSYPARWSRYRVLGDLVQNFYDAVGAESFCARFRHRIEDQVLSLEVEGVGFSYDWLLHFGASTKTGADPGQLRVLAPLRGAPG